MRRRLRGMDYARDYHEGMMAIKATFYEENLGCMLVSRAMRWRIGTEFVKRAKIRIEGRNWSIIRKWGILIESILVVTVGLRIEFYIRRHYFYE
jgi:hypothetical protein